MILRQQYLVTVTALGVIAMTSNTAMAQGKRSECTESLVRIQKLNIKLLDQLEPQQNLDKPSGDFDAKLYREHLLEFNQVVDAGRKHLSDCSEWDSDHDKAIVLDIIAHGLNDLWQPEDAIPIYKKCLALDPDHAWCWIGLEEAYEKLCRFDDAKEAYTRAIEIGGFNETNTVAVEAARRGLPTLEKIINDPKVQINFRELYQCPAKPANENSGTKRFGSGFIVSKQGYVLTNNHVVEGCKNLVTSEGNSLTVVDRRTSVDLALLKLDVIPASVAVFRSGAPPKVGDTVFAFGFPLPDILSSEGNISTGILSATAGVNNNVQLVQISAPVQPGNSGGPLLDSSGHVIGVVVAKLDALAVARMTGDIPENINFAVHWTEVKAFLNDEKVGYISAPSSGQVGASLLADRARQFSVRIECTE
ncbi:MAG: trypsin-like peptidase domain-containing protein [Terracidiphilus sp.]